MTSFPDEPMGKAPPLPVEVRNVEPRDFPAIEALCLEVYPEAPPWTDDYLRSHLMVFPEGQFVAVDPASQAVLGYAATLIVKWDDFERLDSWNTLTATGTFSTHNPEGETLYAAEVLVDPACRGRGVGRAIYEGRRALLERLGLSRIRAGARLRGYAKHADTLTPEHYVQKVVAGELTDPTLSFQFRMGFRVIGLALHYLRDDPESHGHAALIEWRPDTDPPLPHPETH